jgi:excisionase family DNA binding protein
MSETAIATADEFFTVEELAKWLRVKPQTVYQWNYEGTGPQPTRLGPRIIRYRRQDVEVWLAERQRDDRASA